MAQQTLKSGVDGKVWKLFCPDTVEKIAFSDSSIYPAMLGSSKDARLWLVEIGERVAHVAAEDFVQAFAPSVYGWYFALGSSAERQEVLCRVWEMSAGREILRVRHDNMTNAAAFSHNGQLMTIFSSIIFAVVHRRFNFTARLWDLGSGREIWRTSHGKVVYAVAFSPDGRHLATGSADGSLIAVATGTEIVRLTAGSPIKALGLRPPKGFIPASKRVLSAFGPACEWLHISLLLIVLGDGDHVAQGRDPPDMDGLPPPQRHRLLVGGHRPQEMAGLIVSPTEAMRGADFLEAMHRAIPTLDATVIRFETVVEVLAGIETVDTRAPSGRIVPSSPPTDSKGSASSASMLGRV